MTDNKKQTQSIFAGFTNTIKASYNFIDASVREYFAKIIFPVLLFSIILAFSFTILLDGVVQLLSYIFVISGPIIAVLYPLGKYSTYKNKINSEFLLFITHITTLSMANTDRIEIFRNIVRSDEYSAISREIGLFVSQIDNLNSALDEAAKKRAQQTPSDIMADFYEKLAYSVGSGQPLEEFLQKEQDEYIKSYETDYKFRIKRIEYISNLFVGIYILSAFLFVLVFILPYLTSFDIITVIIPVFTIYIVIQFSFIILSNSVAPKDKLWYWSDELSVIKEAKVKISIAIGVVISLAIVYLLIRIQPDISLYFYPIVSVLPLSIPSYFIYSAEKDIKQVESQFGGFIRSLGNIEAVKETSTKNVLKDIKKKNYGKLDKYIETLYNRLYTNIDSEKSWNLFSAKIGSNLIRSFSHMYYTGRQLGSDTDILGDIINKNYNKIQSLRKQRSATISRFSGNLYGTGITMTITLVLTINIVQVISGQIETVPVEQVPVLTRDSQNIQLLYGIVFAIIIVNGILLSILIRVAQRRYILGAVLHIMIFTILSFSVGYAVEYLFERYLTI